MFNLLAENLNFGEGPRWHNDKLWFSDFYQHAVLTVDLNGNIEKIVDIPNQPSGLGWLPNGDMLIVSMHDQKLMRFSDGVLSLHSDLSHLTKFTCNDMVVDNDGHAYIGNFGTTQHNIDVKPTCLIHVTPDGKASIVAENLEFPNGTVITADGKKLIVGETYAGRLTAFDINSDKTLSNRQTWAKMMPTWIFYISKVRIFLKQVPKETNFAPRVPDGICLDEGMGIWVASPTTFEVFRIEEGGNVTDIISTPQRAYACMLGGESGKTLYISTANDSTPEVARSQPMGKIYTTEVKFARAGNP